MNMKKKIITLAAIAGVGLASTSGFAMQTLAKQAAQSYSKEALDLGTILSGSVEEQAQHVYLTAGATPGVSASLVDFQIGSASVPAPGAVDTATKFSINGGAPAEATAANGAIKFTIGYDDASGKLKGGLGQILQGVTIACVGLSNTNGVPVMVESGKEPQTATCVLTVPGGSRDAIGVNDSVINLVKLVAHQMNLNGIQTDVDQS